MDLKDYAASIGYYDERSTSSRTALLVGYSGSGKTTLAGTFPSPFVLDADKGGASLSLLHIPYLELHRGDKTHEICMKVLDDIGKKRGPFEKLEVKTLVLDSLTALGDFLLVEAMMYPWRNTKLIPTSPEKLRPDQNHYGMVLIRYKNIIKMAQDLGLNIVATSGVRTETDSNGNITRMIPSLTGSYREIVAHDFDELYYLRVQVLGKIRKFYVHTQPFGSFDLARSKSKKPIIEAVIEDPTYEKIFKIDSEGVKGK